MFDERLFDLSVETGTPLTGKQIDTVIEPCLQIAEERVGVAS